MRTRSMRVLTAVDQTSGYADRAAVSGTSPAALVLWRAWEGQRAAVGLEFFSYSFSYTHQEGNLMTAEEHESYPNAPLALVTAEIKYPGEIGTPIPSRVQYALSEALGEEWVIDPVVVPQAGLTVLGGMPVMGQPAGFPAGALLRFADRRRETAVAFTGGSISVETTRYQNWPTFRVTLEIAIGAGEKLLRPSGMTRAGLRYINEVRVEGADSASWGEWLSPSVLPPASPVMEMEGFPPVAWNSASQYSASADRNLVLRHGPQPAQPGFVVNPDGPLLRPGPRPTGPFFLLDFDASWQPTTVPRWDSELLLETYDELRHPIRKLFDEIVTERLEAEVFIKGSSR